MTENKKVKLTAKQSRFVEEYCSNGFNATQAALTAGYKPDNARKTASENLSKPDIQNYIQEFMSKAGDKALVTTIDIVKGLYDIAQNGDAESARVSAYKALADYTGGFDANVRKVEATVKSDEGMKGAWDE